LKANELVVDVEIVMSSSSSFLVDEQQQIYWCDYNIRCLIVCITFHLTVLFDCSWSCGDVLREDSSLWCWCSQLNELISHWSCVTDRQTDRRLVWLYRVVVTDNRTVISR